MSLETQTLYSVVFALYISLFLKVVLGFLFLVNTFALFLWCFFVHRVLNLHKKNCSSPKTQSYLTKQHQWLFAICLSLSHCVSISLCVQCSTCNVLFPNTADDVKKKTSNMYHYQATNQQLPSFFFLHFHLFQIKRREIWKFLKKKKKRKTFVFEIFKPYIDNNSAEAKKAQL